MATKGNIGKVVTTCERSRLDMKAMKDNIKAGLIPFKTDQEILDEIMFRQQEQEKELHRKQAEEAQTRAYLASLKADAADQRANVAQQNSKVINAALAVRTGFKRDVETPSVWSAVPAELACRGISLMYAVFYVWFDFKAGSLAAVLCLFCWVGSCVLGSVLGFGLAWKVVLVVQLVSWTAQFIGHGVFEGRAPALLDNLLQAFLMAPFFVLFEALQMVFGYEPYPGFHARVTSMIEAETEDRRNKEEQLLA
ncbi:uncharacterized endoplasmic reticulum membrane protein-like protein [Tanacetum coccineum]